MTSESKGRRRSAAPGRTVISLVAGGLVRLARGTGREIDPGIPDAALLRIIVRKAADATRGLLLALRGARVSAPCFVGRHVRIADARQLSVGRGSELRDYVCIEALSTQGVRIGRNVTLDRHVTIRCTGTLRELGRGVQIQDGSAIGAFSYLGGSGGLVIGRDVLGGQYLSFHPENHVFERPDVPMRDQGTTRAGIVIEDDCWLGSGSIFLDGIRVGRGSVIGAGSVVTEDVPPFSIVGGVPAKVLRSRR